MSAKYQTSIFFRLTIIGLIFLGGCAERVASIESGAAQYFVPPTIQIPHGSFIFGSDAEERERAYQLDEAAYGHSRTRTSGWYGREPERRTRELPAFEVTRTPITNREYREFVQATDHPVPDVDVALWASYGLVHPFERTRRHAWIDREIPHGRDEHPVVLVSYDDARAYARWLSQSTKESWSLPTSLEWEKAIRGVNGWLFPWGDTFDPSRLNSHDAGPFDTVPVGQYTGGASEFGVMDGAGQVFEWTSDRTDNGRVLVKGGSWDDSGCGVCRPAAGHYRPENLKHILIGFRLVRTKH